jgi:peroxiredoxin
MTLRILFAGLVLCAAAAAAEERDFAPMAPSGDVRPHTRASVATEPPTTMLMVGDRVPEFSYLGPDGRWHQLAELLLQGPMLLVFGADDAALQALEQRRGAFLDLGVVPAAVVDMRSSSAAALARRLELDYPLITDPQRAIARLYNSLDPESQQHAPSFFVVDGKRVIRALGHGPLPEADRMLRASARSLGLPLPEAVRSASHR